MYSASNHRPAPYKKSMIPRSVAITVVSSPSLICVGNGSLLNEIGQLLSLHIWCDASKSITHVDDAEVIIMRAAWVASAASHSRSRSPATIPVAVFAFAKSLSLSLVCFFFLTVFCSSCAHF